MQNRMNVSKIRFYFQNYLIFWECMRVFLCLAPGETPNFSFWVSSQESSGTLAIDTSKVLL